MNEITLPPSPNWYLSNILACANDGTIAWGARNVIVIGKSTENSKILDFSIIDRAHHERVLSIAFSPKSEEDGSYRLVSGGDDNQVKIWNSRNLSLELQNCKLDSSHKIIGVDWSKHNPSLVCFVSEHGYLVSWYTNYDTSQIYTLGKMTATCLVCCPHDSNIVAIGSKSGLVYIVDIRGSGSTIYKLRGHDLDIVSLSWCPVPGNIFENKKTKELLLASGAKDRSIFLWKASIDGRYQTQLIFPTGPLDLSTHKSRVAASAGNFNAVCWLAPKTLLSSSPWGELYLWDLTGDAEKKFTPKLIHAKHSKGLFSIVSLADNSTEQTDAEKSTDEPENWRTKRNIKAIWTLAQDRQIICCNILDDKPSIESIIPTQGGFVYCMSVCPAETSQIAFGVGDAMIRLWNLSDPHYNIIEIQMLWEKIKGKVRALSWHPEKENLLAFATNEGRVGIFDTNNKKAPSLCRQYHRHIIYSIGWGPAPDVTGYALYTCGDGELVYYNPQNWNNKPTSVTTRKDCTEFCWKSDYSVLALGFNDGSIAFLNKDLKNYGHTIYALSKPIQRLVWHPESTHSDLSLSATKNYLAVAINDTAITVFDIPSKSDLDKKTDGKSSDESFFKTVAVLKAHQEKVVSLAWSPHISGYLVSGSYDNLVQVWKVETQEVIATFTSHVGPVQCCMWSPLSQDFIISGSSDFTLRIWRISNQKILKTLPSTKLSVKGKRTKKKKVKEAVNGAQVCNGSNDALPMKENEIKNIENLKELTNQELSEESDTKKSDKSGKKKKLKKPNYFPKHSEITHNNKLWFSSIKNVIDALETDTQKNESSAPDCNGTVEKKKNGVLPAFLGNAKSFENALNFEKQLLDSSECYNFATDIDLWGGNLKENLQKAIKEKRLNDYLILLAPSISKEFWEEMCAAYANQLIIDENPHKAAACLLCINRTEEAIDVFMNAKLFKEAYALATLRLDSKDPTIEKILQKWADFAQREGNFQHAIECYLKLGEFVKAAKLLERRKDLDSLILAISIAKLANNSELSTSLADKAVLEALLKSDIIVAKSIIEKYPQLQCRKIQIEVFDEINKVIEAFSDEQILHWLQGSADKALLDCIKERFDKCEKSYSSLLQKHTFPIPSDKKMVQVNVSQQLALSILASEEKLQLQHIVKALDIITQYEKNKSPNAQNKYSLLMRYMCALDNRNLSDPNSIFNNDKIEIAESLRAYLCYATINWFHDNNLNETQVAETTNLIVDILEKCIENLLNKESINFWTAENEIVKLETQLSSVISEIQTSEDDANEKKNIIERLDMLKNNRKEYVDNRVSTPNPLFSYGAMMEFASKITNEQEQKRVTDLVISAWKKAIS